MTIEIGSAKRGTNGMVVSDDGCANERGKNDFSVQVSGSGEYPSE